mgnify:FL=1|tara:strand:- start:234 stop:839 length:606 start_codon:yes stop_codon:yes gene_type:complete
MENNTLKELAKKYNLNKNDFWQHKQSGKYIILHDAVEKIASMEQIEIVDFKVLNSEQGFARFLITMSKGNKKVTTIGEADSKNCVSGYKGMMAEKRGIDRCVLKLINAYEYGIYSDVESDDFKKPKSNFDERQATGSQQDYVYKLLDHTAFTVGKGAKFKEDVKDSIIDIFDSAADTSELINDLKKLKEQFIENQKKHIVK